MDALIAHIIAYALIVLAGLFFFGQALGVALGVLATLGTALYRLAVRAGLIRAPGRQPR